MESTRFLTFVDAAVNEVVALARIKLARIVLRFCTYAQPHICFRGSDRSLCDVASLHFIQMTGS